MARVTSRILIIDYGSQFTQLIARRVREARVYSEIHPPKRAQDLDWVRACGPTGISLSGGPSSVYDEGAPGAPRELLDVAPVLGVCYGMNLVAHLTGGTIQPAHRRSTAAPRSRSPSLTASSRGSAPGSARSWG